jgi:peptidoglycan hydrolase CwlO-like protein
MKRYNLKIKVTTENIESQLKVVAQRALTPTGHKASHTDGLFS